MFQRFTDRARRVLVLAQEEARLLNHSFIGTEHVLLGLLHDGQGVAADALTSCGVSLDAARAKVIETVGEVGGPPSGSPPFTPRAKKVLELSLRAALQLGDTHIGAEHLLLGLVGEGEGVAAQVLASLGADLETVRQRVVERMVARPDVVVEPGPPWRQPRVGPDAAAGRGRPMAVVAQPPERCALCGRDLWEADHFVSAGHARVCDDCVRAAARVLAEAAPEHRRLVLPPRVFGHGADDEWVAAVIDAVQAAFSASTDGAARAAVVEDFDRPQPTFWEHADQLGPRPEATRLSRIRFVGPELAEVQVEITRADGSMTSQAGRVLRRDGRWMVTADTVISVLAGRGVRRPRPLR